jgi:DnaJ-class molecular chaperone
MTDTIKKIIKSSGAIICPYCEGEGEIGDFCGHESTRSCYMCAGRGVVKSLKKQRHTKSCIICNGRGAVSGCGGCDDKGFHEWKSYELWKKSK